ncbi:MAG: hypothetical protein HQ541_18385 [Mariniphaga sp.]|nr:hypothetical protein [Mariniphaga sp.]
MGNNKTIAENHKKRYESTLLMIKKYFNQNERILDVGVENSFSEILI